MNLRLFLVIIRSRFWLILFTLMITVATAAVFTNMQSKRYLATTSLVLNVQGGNNPFEQNGMPAQLYASYIATQLDIISSQNVAQKVVDLLHMDEDPGVRAAFMSNGNGNETMRTALAASLLQNLVVEPSRDSRVVNIGVVSTDPNRSAVIADAFAQAYIATTLELSMEPARRNTAWFNEQLKDLRKRLNEAQARLTDFQQEKGIVAIDERLDTETSRLNELSKNYVSAQAETYDVKSRQLGENHPEYIRAVKRERSLYYSLEQQKKRVLELKKQRDELGVLAREVENEQQTYEATLQSYYQTRLESQFNQTNIAILNPAIPPQEPISPNVLLNMISAIFLGLLLGIVLAVVIEMLNRRIRTAEDVSELLGSKVLATV